MDTGRSVRVVLLVLLGLIQTLQTEARVDQIPGSRYVPARAAALGDAFLPLADDGASALFYNPSNLGLIKETHFEPLNLAIYQTLDFVENLNINFFQVSSLPSYLSTLQENPGTRPGLGLMLFPNFFFRPMAFGALLQTKFSASYSTDGNVSYSSLYQLIPAVGAAVRLAQGIVRLGYSLQYVNEASGSVTTSASSSSLGYTTGINQGSGLSHTLGFGLTFPVRFLPTINVVARNFLGVNYNSFSLLPLASNSPGPPANENMTVDVSTSIAPRFGRTGTMNFVIQMRDILNDSGFSLVKRTSFGLEFGFRETFFLRAGYGSGYPSAGLGLKRPTAEFNFAWYSAEIGTSSAAVRDIRFVVQYQIRVF